MKRTLWPCLALSLFTIQLESAAWACGGCFHPVAADSVVTGHRMAFAISGTRSVLWDQIQYSGSPSEFGWVLPIRPGATIEASTDAWFEALDAFTRVQVTPPQLTCASASGGFGCGSSDSGSKLSPRGAYDRGVTVIHQGTVGPYETVTLRSTTPGSLRSWLSGHGYVVPPDIDPIIDAYISEGSDFIALKLIPGQGVSQMKPVRVVTPGGKPLLPLRMVQAGTGSMVDIVLFVIGEQRYLLSDLTEARVDSSKLAFDFAKNDTNYLTLRDQALSANNGFSFLTAFALRQPFSTPVEDPAGNQVFFTAGDPSTSFGNPDSTLGDLYFDQALSNDGGMPGSCAAATTNLTSDQVVTTAGGTLPASQLECPGPGSPYSDLSAALIGMSPARTWLTRLEMRLPREALSMDCNVAAATEQQAVSSLLLAPRASNRPAGCVEPIFQSRVAREEASPRTTASWALGLFAALAVVRRLRRRRTP